MAKKFVDIDNLKLVWDEINSRFVRSSQFWETLEVLKGSTFPDSTYNGKISLAPRGLWESGNNNITEHEQFRNDFLTFINSDNLNKFIKVTSSSKKEDELYEVINRSFYNKDLGLFEGVILNSLGEDYEQSESSQKVHYWYLRSIYTGDKYRIEWQPYIGYILTDDDVNKITETLDQKIVSIEDKLSNLIKYSINSINNYKDDYDYYKLSLWDKINNLNGQVVKLSQRLDSLVISGGSGSSTDSIQKEFIFSFFEKDENGNNPININRIGSKDPISANVDGKENDIYIKYDINAYNYPFTEGETHDQFIERNTIVVSRGTNLGVKVLFDKLVNNSSNTTTKTPSNTTTTITPNTYSMRSRITSNTQENTTYADNELYYDISFEVYAHNGKIWKKQYINHSDEESIFILRRNSKNTYDVYLDKLESNNPYLFNPYQIILWVEDEVISEENKSNLVLPNVHIFQAKHQNVSLTSKNYNDTDNFNYIGYTSDEGKIYIVPSDLESKYYYDDNKLGYWSNRLYYVKSNNESYEAEYWVDKYDIGYIDVDNNYDNSIMQKEYIDFIPYKKPESKPYNIIKHVYIDGVKQKLDLHNYKIYQAKQERNDEDRLITKWEDRIEVTNSNNIDNINLITDNIMAFKAVFECGDINSTSSYYYGSDNDNIIFNFDLPKDTDVKIIDVMPVDNSNMITSNLDILENINIVDSRISNINTLKSSISATKNNDIISVIFTMWKKDPSGNNYDELSIMDVREPSWTINSINIDESIIMSKSSSYDDSQNKYIYKLIIYNDGKYNDNINITAKIQYMIGNGYEYSAESSIIV